MNKKLIIILYAVIFCTAFFPAFLGYQPEHSRVGYIFTIGFALASYFPFLKDFRTRWRIGLGAVILFWYIIESIGILTCLPYGCFDYSEQLGIQLFDVVPLMLAFTWPPLVLWVWSYAKNYFWRGWKMWLAWAFGLVVVDLILDPIAVSMGLRSYSGWWFWFWVPLTNFLGRIFSGTISMIILDYALGNSYTKKLYTHGMRLTLAFFVGYIVRKMIILAY